MPNSKMGRSNQAFPPPDLFPILGPGTWFWQAAFPLPQPDPGCGNGLGGSGVAGRLPRGGRQHFAEPGLGGAGPPCACGLPKAGKTMGQRARGGGGEWRFSVFNSGCS